MGATGLRPVGRRGGAILTSTAAALSLTGVVIRGNDAKRGGGIATTNDQPYASPVLDLEGVSFDGNTSSGSGGALDLSSSTATLST
ncbi:MAG: hypothetical protein AAFX50_00770 [Acidobacteriota bacterium]